MDDSALATRAGAAKCQRIVEIWIYRLRPTHLMHMHVQHTQVCIRVTFDSICLHGCPEQRLR